MKPLDKCEVDAVLRIRRTSLEMGEANVSLWLNYSHTHTFSYVETTPVYSGSRLSCRDPFLAFLAFPLARFLEEGMVRTTQRSKVPTYMNFKCGS